MLMNEMNSMWDINDRINDMFSEISLNIIHVGGHG